MRKLMLLVLVALLIVACQSDVEPMSGGSGGSHSEVHRGVYGYIEYDDGEPAVGVAVSDGFSVVRTNAEGLYQFAEGIDSRTKYIYYSIPADAKITTDETSRVAHYSPYAKGVNRYDFTLVRGEKEPLFALFAIADTHGYTQSALSRLRDECVGGVRAEAERKGVPCYAIVLGDIVCSTSTDKSADNTNNPLQPAFMDDMRNMFAPSQTGGVPTFFVMGNHDYDRAYFDAPRYADLAEFNLHAQDTYEKKCGPANYSFNRGDAHIVCMRNILWPQGCIDNATSANCYGGFTDEQVEWLRRDLATVSTAKKVILCVHIPLVDLYGVESSNAKRVVDMIARYREPQVLSGHTHTNCDIKTGSEHYNSSYPVSEKTIVGNWGTGCTATANGYTLKCMGDGSPFGFDVYDVSGAAFADHYFVDCTSRKSHKWDDDYVMRAYLSSDVYGGDSNGDGKVYTNASHASHERYFRFLSFTSDRYDTYLHVNVFNGSPDTWRVALYANGAYVKDLAWVNGSRGGAWQDPSPTVFSWKGGGSGTVADPWCPTSSNNSQDWWYISYIVNETAATSTQTTNGECSHKWYGYIPNESMAHIRSGNFYIEATHSEFGVSRTYRTSKIYGRKDYNGVINYK